MKRTGFSLIELLIVIAIISLLMAISFSTLQSCKARAQIVVCGSNIKQIMVALLMYENEEDTLPPAFNNSFAKRPRQGYSGNMVYDLRACWWFNYIDASYYHVTSRKKNVLECPSNNLINFKFKDNLLCGNYGINQSICKTPSIYGSHRGEFIGKPLRTTDIRYPSQTLLLVDSGYAIINWWHATDIPPQAFIAPIEDKAYIPGLKINKDRDFQLGQEQDAIEGRHPNKTVNIGFADGHVKLTKADKLLVEKTEDGEDGYKNLRPIWQPR